MNREILKKIDPFVIVSGVLLSLGVFLLWGYEWAYGTLTGAVVASLNWMAFRWAGVRLASSGKKGRFMVFLGIKGVTIFGIIVLILSVTSVKPGAFLIGISALVLGIMVRAAVSALSEGEKMMTEGEKAMKED